MAVRSLKRHPVEILPSLSADFADPILIRDIEPVLEVDEIAICGLTLVMIGLASALGSLSRKQDLNRTFLGGVEVGVRTMVFISLDR